MPPSPLAGVVSQWNTGEEEQGFKLFRICRAKEQSIFQVTLFCYSGCRQVASELATNKIESIFAKCRAPQWISAG